MIPNNLHLWARYSENQNLMDFIRSPSRISYSGLFNQISLILILSKIQLSREKLKYR